MTGADKRLDDLSDVLVADLLLKHRRNRAPERGDAARTGCLQLPQLRKHDLSPLGGRPGTLRLDERNRLHVLGACGEHVDQHLGLAITIILLLSSLTAFTAETAIEHNNQRVAHWFLMATIVLGIIFAAGVGFEWKTAEFSRHEAFGSVFFTMTGIHASHVVSGIGILFLVWIQMRRGKFNAKNHWPVSGAVMYWHFVDVVWVFFYPALYLVK